MPENDNVQEWIGLYAGGQTFSQIAKSFGVSTNKVNRSLKRCGVVARPASRKRLTDEERVARRKKRYQDRRDEILSKKKLYYSKTHEHIKAYQKRYRSKNPDKIRALMKQYVADNKDKIRSRKREYVVLNKEKVSAHGKRWRKSNWELIRAQDLSKKYGLSLADYDRLLAQQNGVCAICSKPQTATSNGLVRRLCVDHNHATGQVRGLLCRACNMAIGLLKDDQDIVEKAALYLKKYKSAPKPSDAR